MSTIKTGIVLPDGDQWQPSRGELKFLRDNGLLASRRNRQGVSQPSLDEASITARIVGVLQTATIDTEDEMPEVGVTAAQIVQRDFGVTADYVSEECIAWLEKVVTRLLSPAMSGSVQKAFAPESDEAPRVMLVSKAIRRNRRDAEGNLLLDLDNTKVLAYAITTSVDVVDALTLNPLREQKVKAAARDLGRASAMTARMPELAAYAIADARHAAAVAARNVEQVAEEVLDGLPDDRRRAVLAQADALVAHRPALGAGAAAVV